MTINRPRFITWLVALLLGILALAVQYGGVNVPVVSGNSIIVMAVAWALLVLGCALPGL